jgi:hypothetical protein
MKVKTSDLAGAALDWAVAKVQGWVNYPEDSIEHGSVWHTDPMRAPFGPRITVSEYRPSTCWSQGGPLIDCYHLSIRPHTTTNGVVTSWAAYTDWPVDRTAGQCGPTPLIAACRAIVSGGYGGYMEIPDDLGV